MFEGTRRSTFRSAALVACLVGVAASAQALPKYLEDRPFRLALVDSPMTVEAPLSGLPNTTPGGTWTMPLTGAFYGDGLALVGVTFTRIDTLGDAAAFHSFDVVVTLRAWSQADDQVMHLDFVVADGENEMSLARFRDVPVRAGKITSFSQTISINAYDFDSWFAFGKTPMLRVRRTSRSS
jgi:hypothetical protein